MKKTLTVITSLLISTSALAANTPQYDTKFNVSANVPDSAIISKPDGTPVTDLDVVMTAQKSGKMEAITERLTLRNNDVKKLEVALTLDDADAAAGSPFTLSSTQGDILGKMTYKITAVHSKGNKVFDTSGVTNDFTLAANGNHGETDVIFKFTSDKNYDEIGQGNYSGTVYANLIAKP